MSIRPHLVAFLCSLTLLVGSVTSHADNLSEYRLKTAFLYNFAVFTQWPAGVGTTLNVCIYGENPFGTDLDQLQGKSVGARSLAIQRLNSVDTVQTCQIVFISRSVIDNLPRVLTAVGNLPILTVADSPGASEHGVMLNMQVVENKIVFDANLGAAQQAGIILSSKLLRLASKVLP